MQIYHGKVFLRERERERQTGRKRRGIVELRDEGKRKGRERWRIQHVGRVGGSVLKGHVLSPGAEVFVCRAERYRFPLHVSAFI